MDAYVLSASGLQNLKPVINYKIHRTQNSHKRDSGLSGYKAAVGNSDDVTNATTLPMVQDSQNCKNDSVKSCSHLNPSHQNHYSDDVATTSTTATHPVIQVTQNSNIDLIDINSTKHPVKENIQNMKYSHSRFVLCHSYWEQQTNALINMWSFQKWADKAGKLKVVEPFAAESVLEFPGPVLYKHQFTNSLRFRDYFDLDYWTQETAKLGIEPLVTWETFTKYANRKVILAIPSYGAKPPGIFVDEEINKNQRCKFERDKIRHNTKSLFKFLHFKIIKIVCYAIGYQPKDIISFEKFNSYLISDNNATIWFGLWCGIGRLPMSDDNTLNRVYGGIDTVLSMVRPNPKIIDDSRNYVKTNLNADFREYTAISIRSARRYAEMVLKGHTAGDVMNYFINCAGKLKDILDQSGSTRYFLSSDIGKFGDRTAYKLNDKDSSKLLQQILHVVYGNKTINDYENEFIKAANGVEDRGYLASMQKAITEHAKCLIIMGGYSIFQKSLVLYYKSGGQFNCVRYLCYEDRIKPPDTP